MMSQLITELFDEFIDDMEKNREFCAYLDTWDYEDEYSHNQIEEYRTYLEDKIRDWLIENKPGKYYMLGGPDTTYVMTEEELLKRTLNPASYEVIK